LVAKPEGKRPLGKPRRRWEIILEYIEWRVWVGFIWLKLRTSGVPL
jgi:hypothetical protein